MPLGLGAGKHRSSGSGENRFPGPALMVAGMHAAAARKAGYTSTVLPPPDLGKFENLHFLSSAQPFQALFSLIEPYFNLPTQLF